MTDVLNLFNKSRRDSDNPFHWEFYVTAGMDYVSSPSHVGPMFGSGNRFGFNLSEKLQLHLCLDFLFEFDPNNGGTVPFIAYHHFPVLVGARYSL